MTDKCEVGLIINADDWGRSVSETDRALSCCLKGRVTSVSAMVFMADSERAAELALQHNLDVGLHFNIGEHFTGKNISERISRTHSKIVRYIGSHKYAPVLFNPFLSGALRSEYEAQLSEFMRLFGKAPSHVDGHLHNHLCTNLLLQPVIARGQKVRRSFSFFPGEKSGVNRAYRNWVDQRLARRFVLTDYFFSLTSYIKNGRMARVAQLARTHCVELMAHPAWDLEYEFLMGDQFDSIFKDVKLAGFSGNAVAATV